MLAILLDSFSFRLMALLHIAAAIMAFGPVMLYPALRRYGETRALAAAHVRITLPALLLLWVFGMGLAGMSEDAYKMSQTWLALSLIDWAILIAVSWFMIRPAISDPSEGAGKRLSAGIGITHVGMVLGLVLMIWKPGL